MEAVVNALINAGGMGVVAAVLLWLHSKSLERFDVIQQRTLDRFDGIITRTMDVYRAEIAAERLVSQQQHAEGLAADKETRHALREVAHQVSLQGAIIRTALKLPEMKTEEPKP